MTPSVVHNAVRLRNNSAVVHKVAGIATTAGENIAGNNSLALNMAC